MNRAHCATSLHEILNVISSDFCASVFTVYMTVFFIIPLIINEKEGVANDISCCNSHLLLPLSYSLLLLHLGSGFKRLSSSLAPRSNWPLPFICQPFDVVPAWAACYALPLTARSEVRRRLDFRNLTHLDTPHLLCRCVCL